MLKGTRGGVRGLPLTHGTGITTRIYKPEILLSGTTCRLLPKAGANQSQIYYFSYTLGYIQIYLYVLWFLNFCRDLLNVLFFTFSRMIVKESRLGRVKNVYNDVHDVYILPKKIQQDGFGRISRWEFKSIGIV